MAWLVVHLLQAGVKEEMREFLAGERIRTFLPDQNPGALTSSATPPLTLSPAERGVSFHDGQTRHYVRKSKEWMPAPELAAKLRCSISLGVWLVPLLLRLC